MEANAASLENQMLDAHRKLNETVSFLEQEKATRKEIEQTVQQQAKELSVLSSEKLNTAAELEPLEMRAKEAEYINLKKPSI